MVMESKILKAYGAVRGNGKRFKTPEQKSKERALLSKLDKSERMEYFKNWSDSERAADARTLQYAKAVGPDGHSPEDKSRFKRKLNRKTRVENRMGGKLGNTAKKPRFDPKVLSEIEGDILDEGAYEPSDTVSGAQRAVRKAANSRIRQKLPDVENFVFDKGYHEEEPGIETVQDAQAFVKKRAQEIYNRRRGIKPKKIKSRMGKHSKTHITPTENLKNKKRKNKLGNSAIFSGADTINFTNHNNGAETVKAMGASAQDIKTAYRKASLNA